MYAVSVRSHMMIAHSLRGAAFGPAQQLHGATYVIDVEFRRERLDADGIVVDIGRALDALSAVVAELNYRNLDELPEFRARNSTTEVLANTIFGRMAARIRAGELGEGARAVSSMRVRLNESHVAWAAYEGRLDAVVAEEIEPAIPEEAAVVKENAVTDEKSGFR